MQKIMRNLWKIALLLMALLILIAACFGSCGKSWQLEHGDPAAQFLAEDVATKGEPYLGKKITIKVVVTGNDISDPKAAWVYLEHGIRCNLGGFQAMARSYKVGDTVFIDGFLAQCAEGQVVLEPAMGRDRKAPFDPL